MKQPTMNGPKRWPWDYPAAILAILAMVLGVISIVTSVISLAGG